MDLENYRVVAAPNVCCSPCRRKALEFANARQGLGG